MKKRIQEEAQNRGKLRAETVGSILRTKGFVWSQRWPSGKCGEYGGDRETLQSAPNEKEKESFRRSNNFGDASFKDGNRRQELAFIGQELKHASIQQRVLDSCLFADEEFAMGVDG